tara:strand:+ start:173 stop:535 length:363 start_codon:yes stop_codon:yes gene_type:complete
MAHFAKLGTGNKVLQVVVVNNDIITDNDGNEQEILGQQFLNNIYGNRDIWKQTSYNASFRKNFAGINFTYDEGRNSFIEPQPYPSWILNEDTCRYDPPIEKPDGNYVWNELHRKWDEIVS